MRDNKLQKKDSIKNNDSLGQEEDSKINFEKKENLNLK